MFKKKQKTWIIFKEQVIFAQMLWSRLVVSQNISVNNKSIYKNKSYLEYFAFSECVRLIKWHHFIFLRLSNVWNMLRHGSVEVSSKQKHYFMFSSTFFGIFCCFSSWNLCFHHFNFFFFDEASNFRNRILIN